MELRERIEKNRDCQTSKNIFKGINEAAMKKT